MEEVLDGDLAIAGSPEQVPVPSGQPVTLQDVVWSIAPFQPIRLRFRFVAPEIRVGGTVDFAAAAEDMMALCRGFARATMATEGRITDEIIISMAEKPVAFGETLPDVVQFFEAFKIEGDTCTREIY
jgi:Family of unknown function (DUF6497)